MIGLLFLVELLILWLICIFVVVLPILWLICLFLLVYLFCDSFAYFFGCFAYFVVYLFISIHV